MNELEIERIYESAILPELWPDTLKLISDNTRSIIGLALTAKTASDVSVITSPGMSHVIDEYNELNLFERSERMPRMLGKPYSGFTVDSALFSEDEMACDPAYTEFFWPRGWGHGTATAIRLPNNQTIVFNFERERAVGAYDAESIVYFDSLRPHLGRSSLLMMKMEQERAKARVSALEAIGLAAAVLDKVGRILACNARMHALIPSVFLDTKERMKISEPGADFVLKDAILRSKGGSRSIALNGTQGGPPMVLHLLPIVRGAQDIFSNSAHLVTVLPISSTLEALPADIIEVLFDLTPSESKVARWIASGETVDSIASLGNWTRETVRTYVKIILSKTGTTRQGELIALLTSASLERTASAPERGG